MIMPTKITYYFLWDAKISSASDLVDLIGDGGVYAKTLCGYIFRRWEDNWIDVEYNDADPAKDLEHWRSMFVDMYNLTVERYTAILDSYETNKTKLLQQLSSTTYTKSNTAPQSGDVDELDDYVNTMGSIVVTSDNVDTVMKLEEIYRNYRNVMSLWVMEFKPLFGGTLKYE